MYNELGKHDAATTTMIISGLIADNLLPALVGIGNNQWTELAENAFAVCETLRKLLREDLSSIYALREMIIEKSYIEGDFTLASGAVSSYFFNLKPTMLDPKGASLIADVVWQKLSQLVSIEAIGGLAMGAVPIAAVICAKSYTSHNPLSAFFVRKVAKDHGTEQRIDGADVQDKRVALIEDVSTTGKSLLLAAQAVREAGGEVKDAITVIDRLEGARQNLGDAGITLHAIFTREDFSATKRQMA